LSVTGFGHAPDAIPESASEQVNVTVTGGVRYPEPFGVPEIDTCIPTSDTLSCVDAWRCLRSRRRGRPRSTSAGRQDPRW